MKMVKVFLAALTAAWASATLATTGETLHGAALQAARQHAQPAQVRGERVRSCPAAAEACVVKFLAHRGDPASMRLLCKENDEAYFAWVNLPGPKTTIPAQVQAYQAEHLGWNVSNYGEVIADPVPSRQGNEIVVTLKNHAPAPSTNFENAKVVRVVFWYRCVANRGASALPAR